ncbi:MAG: beta-N-acetylhexosaminidase [Thermomicrobiales bacterium]|nr:beta-N-acetylhexosaminidase [Thermomicrobiales bacterium]
MINIIPAPQQVLPGEGTLKLDETTQIVASVGAENAATWLRDGLARFAKLEIGAGAGSVIHLTIKSFEATLPESLGVRADGDLIGRELHTIEVTAKGVTIEGVSAEAVFRGATSLIQMAALNGGNIPVGTIIDAPRFAWRGLSFDVVRCFHPASTVRDVIDLLALYKMNVLHWHLTDTEGWRVEVPGWPKLTEVSGKTARNDREGGYYTAEEFSELVQYAADRYITVVPEFDSPGHTASVLAAYPELAAAGILDTDPAMHYLHPNQPGVPDLLKDVYSSLAATTNGARIHIGGDEAIAMTHEDFQSYIQMALPIARGTGKGVVAWQEAARGGLSEGDVVQWWIPNAMVEKMRAIRDSGDYSQFGGLGGNIEVAKAFIELFSSADEDVPLALEQGAMVLLSPATDLYLDTKYPELSIDPLQGEQHERLGMPQRVYEQGTVADSYDWDPVTIHENVPADRIAGIEAAIWCEFIEDRSDLFFQLLPRLAGSAEKAWSQNLTWADHKARLMIQPTLWDAMELPYFKSSVVWDS